MMRERYLHWAKTHPAARFELTVSGAPRVSAQELGIRSDDVDTIVQGTYGHPELITRIAALHGVDPATVLPVPGASMANFIALACAVGRGKRVAIESPAYEPLLRTAEFLGLEILRFERDSRNGFAPDVDQVAAALQAGARAVVMTDLHNPSGRLCPADVMRAMAARCAEHGAYFIVDEIYRDFAHINREIPRATAVRLGPHVIVTNSLTKAYGFGGLRAGWTSGAPELMDRARDCSNHLFVDFPAPSASLAIKALSEIGRFAARTRAIYDAGYPIIAEWASARDDVHGYGNDGALFSYFRLSDGVDADKFCELLRRDYDTQVVSGSFFGQPDHIRIGFGVEASILAEGLRRVGEALRARI